MPAADAAVSTDSSDNAKWAFRKLAGRRRRAVRPLYGSTRNSGTSRPSHSIQTGSQRRRILSRSTTTMDRDSSVCGIDMSARRTQSRLSDSL
jgi:hypothetical protein